ncbi:serine/threonine protein kinase [Cladophialophora psammophila CBS 110553]|uniref:Serine/threonine protein kinase n=1 Tax=Cladophialophora psammophila CBS 110553 TaxID=1182543 RepID=W9WUT3_9EURO|nr:serine/threonine protein kinase [Cladophialophora psammophila CBS 110553]EXJ71728.1 serine/threonine protein kinase [Cladophialophora psammophila CBS 110553]
MEAKLEAAFPFWLDAGAHSTSKSSGRPSRHVAAFIAATSRLPVYQQDQLIKIKPLGSGTSFQVDECKDTKSGDLVVAKQLRTKQDSGELYDGAVLQELKVSVYPPFLKHDNIVRTLGFLESEDPTAFGPSVSLVLEHADHGSLAEYLSGASCSMSHEDWLQRQNLMLDICSGLEILHRCRVIHGDVKPDNILLFSTHSSTGCPLMAKLADFGSSIVEDTIYDDIDEGISSPTYRGTPLYVPGYLRKYSGKVPFHLMPAVEIYSFGLLLWSICAGEPYYLRLVHPDRKDMVECLDSLGTEGLRQQFQLNLEVISNTSDCLKPSVLGEVFDFCVRDVEIDHSPILPIDREIIYRKEFAAISEVWKILSSHTSENSVNYHDQTSLWQPFHLGSIPSRENVDHIPWALQCDLVQQLVDKVNNRQESVYQRGKAALQLSSHYAVGLGCKKDYENVLHYIQLSAALGDNVAQLICPRVFQSHGKLIGQDDLEDILRSFSYTEEATSDYSDADMEDLANDMNHEEADYGTDSIEALDDPMQDTGGLESDSESTSDSDTDLRWSVFLLSAIFDRDFDSKVDTEPADYFWMKIRMFERAMGFASQGALLRYRGEWYGGLDDTKLVTALEQTAVSSPQVPEVELKCEDGTLIHNPALHHVVFCGMFKLAKQLIDHGWSLNAVNDEGDTLLHLAMRHGDSQMTEYLIRRGINVAVSNFKGVTPLHYLSMFGSQERNSEDGGNYSDAQIEKLGTQHVVEFSGPDVDTIANMLVDAGADVNASMGRFDSTVDVFFSHRISGTPLHAAVTLGNKSAVQTLLRLGADVEIRPFHDSDTALELAAQLHLADIAELLLDHGASLRSVSESGSSSGTWAMHHVGSHVPPLSRWLLHGSRYKDAVRDTIRVFNAAAERENLSLDELNEAGLTAFEYALQESGEDTHVIEAFLDCGAILPPNALSTAVLSCGSDEANASKVELVLQHVTGPGPTISGGDNSLYTGESSHALHVAASTGALAAAKLIISYFASESESLLRAQNDEGLTVLHEAVIAGDISMTTYLLSQNSQINFRDREGRTALATAVALGNKALVPLLMLPDADMNIREGEHDGGTILHIAVQNGPRRSLMLAFLLSADFDEATESWPRFPQLHIHGILDAVDAAQGNTALHLAAYSGDYPSVFALLAAGAIANVKNRAGSIPLDLVRQRIKLHESQKEQPVHFELEAALKKCATHLERAKT